MTVSAISAIRLSLLVAFLGAALGLPIAIVLGHTLARLRGPLRTLLSSIVLMPLVLPPVVTGFLLLALLGRRGLLGAALEAIGVVIPFSLAGAVIAGLAVGLPLYVMAARAAFEAVDPRHEELARTLGLTRWQAFRRVSLPLARSGLAAGAVLAFARALGEFGATAVLAGDVEGRTRTLALAVYALLETPGGEPLAWTLSGVSVVLSVLALGTHEWLAHRARSDG